jgi:uncharacterized protein YgbK (DUF1537 family)
MSPEDAAEVRCRVLVRDAPMNENSRITAEALQKAPAFTGAPIIDRTSDK